MKKNDIKFKLQILNNLMKTNMEDNNGKCAR